MKFSCLPLFCHVFLFLMVIAFVGTQAFGQTPYLPPDFNDEVPFPAHTYWEANGQITNYDGDVVQDLRYYTIGTGPKLFVFDDKISFVHYFTDTIINDTVPNDTTWRVDMKFICDSGEPGPEEPGSCGLLSAHEKSSGKMNYYLPHIGGGLTGVEGHQRLVYEDAFPDIDFHLYSNGIGLKSYIVINPGGDPADILFEFNGQDDITTQQNQLRMILGQADFKFPQAFAWQLDGGGNPQLLGWIPTWNKVGQDRVDVTTGAYDTSKPLILQIGGNIGQGQINNDNPGDNIDWSTFVGDNKWDWYDDLITDNAGDVYGTGATQSANFPVAPGQTSVIAVAEDVVFSRFNGLDKRLEWTTIIGGSSTDIGVALAQLSNGDLAITGFTSSFNLIPGSPFSNQGTFIQQPQGGTDAFLIRANDIDGIVDWVTYYGGFGEEKGYDIAASGNDIYVTGSAETSSITSVSCGASSGSGFPLCDAGGGAYYQSVGGGALDAFAARFDVNGGLTWSTWIGGDDDDEAYAIGRDGNDNLFIAGRTATSTVPSSTNGPCGAPTTGEFPLCNPGGNTWFQNTFHGLFTQGFILRFDNNHQQTWGTYFGWDGRIVIANLAFNSQDQLYVVGYTGDIVDVVNTCSPPNNGNLPLCTPNGAYAETRTNQFGFNDNLFIARFSDDGELIWSTPYGEEAFVRDHFAGHLGLDVSTDLAIDDDDNVYVTGVIQYNSSGFTPPTFPAKYFPGYYQQWSFKQTTHIDADAVILNFNDQDKRQWATHFGGGDPANGINQGFVDFDRFDEGMAIAVHNSSDMYIAGSSKTPDLYQACPIPGTSYCQCLLGDLSLDGFVSRFDIAWISTHTNEVNGTHSQLEVFPNPAQDRITIDLGNAEGETAVRIYSLGGKLVEEQQLTVLGGQLILPIRSLGTGVYLMHISNDGETYTTKFVKE